MSRRGVEAKPFWREVPAGVRAAAERALGSRVVRAERVFGGYAPSATFRMRLADGRRAFFKGVGPAANEFMVAALAQEERVYGDLGALIRPWAPSFLGSVREGAWHALLLEDVGPADVPPWTPPKVRDAARSFAAFHRSTIGRALPDWVTDAVVVDFASSARRLADDPASLRAAAALAGERSDEARAWLSAHVGRLAAAADRAIGAAPPHALLYLDARGDNVRWNHGTLRIFDWNWVALGPPEADAAAFAEGIAAEHGPPPEAFMAEYARHLPVREEIVAGAAAALGALFARSAARPAPPDLPRIRSIQRRQLRASLAWAARMLDLPAPEWLDAVPR